MSASFTAGLGSEPTLTPESLLSERLKHAPGVLWHYTTPAGLIGILKQGALRATGLAFLNDTSEGRYLNELILEQLSEMTSGEGLPVFRTVFEEQMRELGVVCMCENGDLLSQWRGYSTGGGFAIGFSCKELLDYWEVKRSDGVFAPVDYSPETSAQMARKNAGGVADAWRHLLPLGRDTFPSVREGKNTIYQSELDEVMSRWPDFTRLVSGHILMSGFYKDRHFAEEKEWRLVTALRTEPANTEVGVGASGLSVFRTVGFQASPTSTPIHEIRIGPGLDKDSQTQALRLFLDSLGYSGIEISASDIPYRAT